ncbi:hypothetical protein [Sphingomonas sp. DC1600-2]|uniref:hypothetical protein n=1 Tax=unclassified Sphingomonas TaxID=196159 RepID=UPI003CED557B
MATKVDPQTDRAAGTVAATTSVAAVACAACCVLPFALPAAMLGTMGGFLATLAMAHQYLAPLAILAVVAGWLWIAYQSLKSGRRPGRRTLFVMVFATVMAGVAYSWPMLVAPPMPMAG